MSLLSGKYAVMNFMPFNSGEGLVFRRPSGDRAQAMATHLLRHGILTKPQQSAGQDVDGGCGQLRARAVRKGRSTVPVIACQARVDSRST